MEGLTNENIGRFSPNISDEIVEKAISGDKQATDAVFMHFTPLLRSYANTYFIVGGDKDDVLQEGMLGLFSALRDYNKEDGEFQPFAITCIKHRIFAAIRASRTNKQAALNTGVELSENEISLSDDPMELILKKEWKENFWSAVETKLSKTERTAVVMYTSGRSYEEIAQALQRDVKTVDNALSRARKKLIKELV